MMKLKYLLPLLIFALVFSGCGKKKIDETANTKTSATTKLLINELPLAERPFTVLVPHETNRLFTFVTQGADKAISATLDLEYQSGDLLKGAKIDFPTPITNPFMKGIILGSCSTGGKCSFDTDLKSGTIKLKLNFADQKGITQLLKGDFVFTTGQQNLPDGKVSFVPSKATGKDNLILMNSLGLPKEHSQETLLYPIIISSVSDKAISGTLMINQTDVVSASIYDGTGYKDIPFSTTGQGISIKLDHKPWSMPATITRDDDKGTQQTLTLYILGPILLNK